MRAAIAAAAFLLLACEVPAATVAPPASLQPLLTLGCLECEGPEIFDGVYGAAVLNDSTVVVLNQSDPRIRTFSMGGEHLGSWGRTGEGPGEFGRFISGMGPGPASTLVTVEPDRGMHWSPGGDLLGYLPQLERRGYTRSAPIQRWAQDRFSSNGDWMIRIGASSIGYRGDKRVEVLLVDLVRGDTIRHPVPESLTSLTEIPATTGYEFRVAIDDQGRWAIAEPVQYRVELRGPDGRLIASGGRDIAPLKRSEEELEEARNRRLPLPLPEGVTVPEFEPPRLKPQVGFVAFDSQGRLWVQSLRPPPGGGTRLDILSPALEYQGSVDLAVPLSVHSSIQGDLLVGIGQGALGEPMVHISKILP